MDPGRSRVSRGAASVGRRRDEPAVAAGRPISFHGSGDDTKCLCISRQGPQGPRWRGCFAIVADTVSPQRRVRTNSPS